MNAIFYIARNTFLETIRNKVLYLVFFFAVGVLGLGISVGDWSVFARVQVIEDFGLAAMSLCGLMLATFIGVGMLGTEIAGKTIYNLLARPVSRSRIIIGKFAGLAAVIMLVFCCMSLFFLAELWLIGSIWDVKILRAILLCGIEMLVLISSALFFSTVASPLLAALFTLGMYGAGHLNNIVLEQMAVITDSVHKSVLTIVYYTVPNLEHFNIRTQIVYNLPIPAGFTLWAAVYGLLYCILFLTLATLCFSRKDL